MSPEQIELVERTFAAVRPHLAEVAADFYRRLFATDPSAVALFSSDPALQQAKLGEELERILLSIRRFDDVRARAQAPGVRHAGYGVRAGHYGTAGAALLAAVATALGDGWTAEVERAWRSAYGLTVELMTSGEAGAGDG